MEQKSTLKEKAQHGNSLFPMQRYTTILSPLCPEFSIHWHPEMEFTKILKGQAVYTIDFQEYLAREGDFICIQPGMLHTARTGFQGNMSSDSFVFHLNLLGGSLADICTLRYISPLIDGSLRIPRIISRTDPLYPGIQDSFLALSEIYSRKEPGYELEIKSILFHLFMLLCTHPETFRESDGKEDSRRQRVKTVFDFIHNHYTEDIRIETLAGLCCVSPSRFMHLFKEASGTTFNQYLNQYRIRQSALFLRQGMEITCAAYSCGFNNLPYFYKRFQEYFHMTPRQFQKSYSSS